LNCSLEISAELEKSLKRIFTNFPFFPKKKASKPKAHYLPPKEFVNCFPCGHIQ